VTMFLRTCPRLGVRVLIGGETLYRQSVAIEVDGKRWIPAPDSTATAQELIAALALLHEIHEQLGWSPWVMQDRAGEYDAALKVCGQWISAEPEPPGKTLEEYEAELDQRMAEADARFLAAEAQAEKDRAARAEHYDPDRAQARLALLEEQGILASKVREREQILSGDMFPAAPEQKKRRLLADLERDIAAKTKKVDRFIAVIGDPETVPDAKGWLPAERREMALVLFKSRRDLQVLELRARIGDAQATPKSLKDRAERAKVRETLRQDQAHLAYWEQMAPLQAADMCSECESPAWHAPGVTYSTEGGFYITGGPCPAWPRWANGVAAVREAVRQAREGPPKEPPPPPPQPIAVLAPVLVEEVIAQLTSIQAAHPGAEVRQGRGHRWEIWPAPSQPEPPGH
jgi:hypothetical protein